MGKKHSSKKCKKGKYSGEVVNSKMSGWKKGSASPADCYIERRFECKCEEISDGFGILTEWRKRKQQYTAITGTIIYDFQHYSRHDATHSVAILEAIEMLLGKRRIDMLSVGDLWLLLEVAYKHDTGMALTYKELIFMWEKDEKFQQFIKECVESDFGDLKDAALFYQQIDNLLRNKPKMKGISKEDEIDFKRNWPVLSHNYVCILVAEYIRKKHAERVTRLADEMENVIESVIFKRLDEATFDIAQIHGGEFRDLLKTLKYREKGFGNTYIHPQFVAAMLRIGDLLDIDNNRFSPYAIKHFGRLPLSSMSHLKKHSAIKHLDISENQVVVEAYATEYDAALVTQDWFGWINKEVENLICSWNEIAPEALCGCILTKSDCKVFLLDKESGIYNFFNSDFQREFSVNKKKLIKLLIGTSLYDSKMEFLREYIQNAIDATKMQMWIDLKNKKYEIQRNQKVDIEEIIPLDLEEGVYNNYPIKISAEWNETGDRILIKITDRGIGIESQYLKNLSKIGSGWRGRTQYEHELREMPKWLYPTGGFGIGIQSAFMVTDSVEVLTKSNRDVSGYKIILESPERGGSISVEEKSGYDVQGTTILVEVEPERIQNWMEKSEDSEEKFLLREINCEFREKEDDIFCPNATLKYMREFLWKYVKVYVRNPLFPIEISSPGIEKSLVHKNPYWGEVCYWKEGCPYDFREILSKGKNYLCLYNLHVKRTNARQFLIWSYTEQMFCVIKFARKADIQNIQVCFKNVLVKGADKEQLELYNAYQVYIDFMGFRAEECLKVHRNLFDEQFDLAGYCRESFLIYFHYLQEHLLECKKEWSMFEARLLRFAAFDSTFDENEDRDILEKIQAEQYNFSMISESDFIFQTEKKNIEVDLMSDLGMLCNNLPDTNLNIGEKIQRRGIVLALNEAVSRKFLREDELKNKRLVPPMVIKEWLEQGIVKGRAEQERDEITDVLDILVKGTGAVTDSRVVPILLRNKKLDRKIITFKEQKSVLYLTLKKTERVYGEQEFYECICEVGNSGNSTYRKIFTGKNAEKYEELCISKIPFEGKNHAEERKYLIAPFNKEDYRRVKEHKREGKKLDASVFREIIWGKKGEESHNYQMMIDWVFKHQYQPGLCSKDQIKEEYERFLENIYKKYVCNNLG